MANRIRRTLIDPKLEVKEIGQRAYEWLTRELFPIVKSIREIINKGSIDAATWSVSSPGYIAVSYSRGDDENVGFSDVSMEEAGKVALKTLAALRDAVDRIGAGRKLVIAIETRPDGANYLAPDGVIQDSLILEDISGYQKFLLRGTITDATAGSIAFSNSAADKLMAGFVRAIGTNTNGYNVSTVNSLRDFTIQLAGGGAVALETSMALSGWRIRFDVNTPTAVLRNQTRMLSEMSTTTRILIDENTSASPATGNTGDIFYIEMPGIAVKEIAIDIRNVGIDPTENILLVPANGDAIQGATSIVGIRQTDPAGSPKILGPGDTLEVCGVTCLGGRLTFGGQQVVTNSAQYSDETGAVINVGCGTKNAGILLVYQQPIGFFAWNSSTNESIFILNSVMRPSIGQGSMIFQADFTGCGHGAVRDIFDYCIGLLLASTTRKYPCVYGNNGGHANHLRDCCVRIGYIEGRGAGSAAAIALSECSDVIIRGAFGAAGNTGVGIGIIDISNSRIEVDTTTTTITGTAGDVQYGSGPTITSYANLAAIKDLRDDRGNVSLWHATATPAWSAALRLTPGSIGNYPVLGADPGTLIDGDVWITDIAGTRSLCARIGGTTYRTALT